MMEGVASEAASLAGHLGLSNLCWIYDSNTVTIEGHTARLQRRRRATVQRLSLECRCGSATPMTRRALLRALEIFRDTKDRPTLIIVDSIIGYGAPHKQNTAAAHSDPLGVEEVRLAKRFYGWPEDAQFLVPDGVYDAIARWHRRTRAQTLRDAGKRCLPPTSRKHPEAAREIAQLLARELPAGLGCGAADHFRPTKKALPRGKRPARCSMRSPSVCHGSSAAPAISLPRPRRCSNSTARAHSSRENRAVAICISASASTPWAPS